MVTIGLKKISSDPETNFDVLIVPDFEVKEDKGEYTNYVKFKKILATYRKWTLTFALLTEAQMDFLAELKTVETPQFIYSGTTYNIRVESLKNAYIDATLTIVESEVMV